MALEYSVVTHPGSKKDNEDAYFINIKDNQAFFVMADGCGAHKGAKFASEAFCHGFEKALETFKANEKQDPEKVLTELFLSASRIMAETLQTKGAVDAATTCAIAWLNNKHSVFAHVGDSRIYWLKEDKIIWHSKDHSLVQSLVDAGKLTEAEAMHHRLSNVLLNALSVSRDVLPTIAVFEALKPQEGIVLCTDGFWQEVTEKDFLSLFHAKHMQDALAAKVEGIAHQTGYVDNITAIFIRPAERG